MRPVSVGLSMVNFKEVYRLLISANLFVNFLCFDVSKDIIHVTSEQFAIPFDDVVILA